MDQAPDLARISKKYKGIVHFIGFFPNFASKPDQIKAFREKYALPFDLKTDYYKKVALQFDVKILPEVIVYQPSTKKILYRGLINDLYLKPSKRRYSIKTHYLDDVLEDIINNDKIRHKFTEPVGCFVNYEDQL
jgi:hypothetical protein